MTREIVLDTETTGLDPRQGHRLVEVACVELRDLLPTGNSFHRYIDPQRDIDPEAQRVHGLSREFLSDKPIFMDTAAELLDFIGTAPIVAHNAGFDRGFLNSELERAGFTPLLEPQWVDSLALAQKRYPGMFNSLDALCKRFKISLADREKHGALVDARLLAGVYLELRGGRETTLNLEQTARSEKTREVGQTRHGPRPRTLPPRLTADDLVAHRTFIETSLKADVVWKSR